MNASEPIRRHAQRTPDAIAYVDAHGRTTTYAILERSIDAVAHRIRDLGLVPGQTAALATNNLLTYIVIALALARLGIARGPIMLPAHLTDIAILDRGAQGNDCARTVTPDDLSPADLLARGSVTPVAPHGDGAAILMHCPTSGTTGRPKFTPISHDLAMRRVDSRALGLEKIAGGRGTAAARQVSYSNASSSYGFSSLLIVLCGGGTVVEPSTDKAGMASWLARSGVNYIVTSPLFLHQLAEMLPAQRGPNSLETIEVGGGVLPANVYELARERMCANIIASYGLTEAGRVAFAPAEVARGNPGVSGYPYPGVEIQIVDEDDRPVPAGQEGIVRIRSEQNASGYLDDPEASAAVFRGDFVYPGDRGVLAPDGLLRLAGRVDEMINTGGAKVSPYPLEAAMMAFGGVREVAVFGAADRAGVVHVCAAIVADRPIDMSAFHVRCRKQFGPNAPVYIMQLRELPRNAEGKIVRSELARIAVEANRPQTPRLGTYASRVGIHISLCSVRCTGHLFAISSSFARVASSRSPSSVITRSMRSILPSFVSHSAQSVAYVFVCINATATRSSGIPFASAYRRMVIAVQAPSPASSRS